MAGHNDYSYSTRSTVVILAKYLYDGIPTKWSFSFTVTRLDDHRRKTRLFLVAYPRYRDNEKNRFESSKNIFFCSDLFER